jgi:hypothetical protein
MDEFRVHIDDLVVTSAARLHFPPLSGIARGHRASPAEVLSRTASVAKSHKSLRVDNTVPPVRPWPSAS